MVVLTTKHGDPDELSVRDMLERLLARYDTRRWEFTDRVVIEQGAIPHSHPVLTLGTRFIVRTPLGLLTTYLHEQLHWYLVGRDAGAFAAMADLRQVYPEVPDAAGGGAQDEESTYLHLIVNWLELESLKAVVGKAQAEETCDRRSTVPYTDGSTAGCSTTMTASATWSVDTVSRLSWGPRKGVDACPPIGTHSGCGGRRGPH